VTGAPDGTSLYQCALPVDADLPDSRCSSIQPLFLDAQGNYQAGLGIIRPVIGTPAGERIDCRVEACALTLFSESGARLVEPVPISFAPPPSATLQPSEGLLDGQDMTLVVENVQPGHPYYTLGRCIDYYTCQSLGPLTVGPDGRIEVTVPAAQQFTPDFSTQAPVYCRANCLLIVRSPLAIGFFLPYAMAEGDLTVTPATGLGDGQEVQVTGRDLMSTYDGVPAGPYATGGWALTQCDRAVLDQPHLLGVFTHCSVPPPTRGVTIEGSTLDTTFEVQATITRILGGTTNCAAAPDACVVGLVRLEQDLSISIHLVPVTFD
jgi:hypothetical protein